MNYWLVKSEPDAYSYDDLVQEGIGMWDGVRNYGARNYLRQMETGDQVFFYHSRQGLEIVGVCEVVRPAYPDPTAEKGDWSAVDLKALHKLPHPVSLKTIKANTELADIRLIKQSRLSVMPIEENHWHILLKLSEKVNS